MYRAPCGKSKRRPLQSWRRFTLLEKLLRDVSGGVVESLGEDTTTVQGVVNDLTNCRHVGVYIHAVAGAEVADDALGRDLKGGAHQLRVTTCLDVINHLQPFRQRKCFNGNHCSSAPYFSGPRNNTRREALY